MLISATADVSTKQLSVLASGLADLGSIEIDESRTFHKATEPPSWIALFDQVQTWAVVLGPSAAIFLAELLKEAAKDSWRHKEAIARAFSRPGVLVLKRVSAALSRFQRSSLSTSIDVGIPRPDDHFGTRLRLEGDDPEAIALELALFIHHCGAIGSLLDAAEEADAGVVGQISLTLLPDGSMHAEWLTRDLGHRSTDFPPPRA